MWIIRLWWRSDWSQLCLSMYFSFKLHPSLSCFQFTRPAPSPLCKRMKRMWQQIGGFLCFVSPTLLFTCNKTYIYTSLLDFFRFIFLLYMTSDWVLLFFSSTMILMQQSSRLSYFLISFLHLNLRATIRFIFAFCFFHHVIHIWQIVFCVCVCVCFFSSTTFFRCNKAADQEGVPCASHAISSWQKPRRSRCKPKVSGLLLLTCIRFAHQQSIHFANDSERLRVGTIQYLPNKTSSDQDANHKSVSFLIID